MKGEKALGLKIIKHCKEPSIKQIQSMSFNLNHILNTSIFIYIEAVNYNIPDEEPILRFSISSPLFYYQCPTWEDLQDKYTELMRSKNE